MDACSAPKKWQVPACVIEDALAGVQAARAGNMVALGVARNSDAALLRTAGADLMVTSLDDVAVEALIDGRLSGRHDQERIHESGPGRDR